MASRAAFAIGLNCELSLPTLVEAKIREPFERHKARHATYRQ
jgi:hypothetical protein